ncbi:MAG: hypothetical protein KKB50_14325 [Planctomycetes bacterium]|nr:hypothetical protein [Planctomycetota bacterium]
MSPMQAATPPLSLAGQIHEQQERRRYVLICVAIIALCVALKLPTLFFGRLEYDEQIYWELTGNWLQTGDYSLRSTSILSELPPAVYDRPLFHHPPLFSMLLAPFVAADSLRAAILISWLGHVLAVVGVAMICWAWRRRSWHATNVLLWLPVSAVALDPVFTFCSRKLWPDNLVGGLAALSIGLFCIAAARLRPAWAAIGGLTLGMAALTKLPALILMPIGGLLLWLTAAADSRMRRRLLLAAALPAGIILLPWFAVFYSHYACLLPHWIHPDQALIEMSGLSRRAVSQPWHYFLSESVLVAPLVAVVLVGYILRRRHVSSPTFGIPLAWVALTSVTLTVLGLRGQGLQLRYLAPAIPGLYVMLAALLVRCDARRSLLPLLALLAVIYGAVCSGFYLLSGSFDEIVSVPEILWRSFWESSGR